MVSIENGTPGAVHEVPGTRQLNDISCSGAGVCLAVDISTSGRGAVVPVRGGVPGTPLEVSGVSSLSGVDCPSATTRVAVGGSDTAGRAQW